MSAVNNTAAAQAIATALHEGLQHPGDPERGTRPTTSVWPQFRLIGPPPYQEGLREATRLISESIIYLIEDHLQCAIVPTAQLEQLQTERDKLDAENAELRAELDEIGRTL